MLTAVEIENFKAFGSRQRIEIAPITMLFGENSAGKSSFFQALFLLYEIFENNDISCTELSHYPGDFSLGGFRHAVHNSDSNAQIRFRLEFTPSEYDRFGTERRVGRESSYIAELRFTIEICLAHNQSTYLESIKVFHDMSVSAEVFSVSVFEASSGTRSYSLKTNLEALSDWWSDKRLDCGGGVTFDERDIYIPLSDSARIHSTEDDEDEELANAIQDAYCTVIWYVKILLEDLIYVGPVREVPSTTLSESDEDSDMIWANGLRAWQLLRVTEEDGLSEEERIELLEKVNSWLKRLGVKAEVDNRTAGRLNTTDEEDFDLELFRPSDTGKTNPLRVQDFGYGLSQIVPVITALAFPESKTVITEQPELHLHPRLQAELGDLLIHFCSTDPETQAIIETHSEHLILRLLRRIRETRKGTCPTDLQLSSRGLAIYHLKQEDGAARAVRIDVDINGDFIQPWPDDFFEIDSHERFAQ